MDDIYDHLENYEDVKKNEQMKLENKELKDKIEGYTTTIAKLQKDFDKLAAEHRKLEQNYSSLLKTARAEIERKTLMIKELNIEKDKLIISARQNKIKQNYRYKRIETVESNNNENADSSVQEQSDEVITKIHNSKPYCKNDNVQSAHSFINGKTDTNIDMGRNNLHTNNQSSKSCVPEGNDIQVLDKLDNKHNENRLKKITDRRKSMPVLSNDIKFSSEEDCENSIESDLIKKNYQNQEEATKRFVGRNYNGNRMSETSSIENYSRYHDTFTDSYSNKRTNSNKSKDRYESSYRKREKHSPDRFYQTGANNYGDDYYQKHVYGSRRAYERPSHEMSYHNSRSRDRRSNYDRDHSRDFIRKWNDDERYVEKHSDDYDEPSFKRQKFDHGYRSTQDYNRWQKEQDYAKRSVYAPSELREQFSCQSPDHMYNEYIMPTDPVKEIKYTAIVPLEDPRLTSKKYKTVTCSDKEFITTIVGRNVDILPVNKTAWGFVPIPMPKLLLEPPECFSEDLKSVDIENHNQYSYNLRKKSSPSHTVINSSDDLNKRNLMSLNSGSVLKRVQKRAVDNKIMPDSLCEDIKQNDKTMKDSNIKAGLETSFKIKNRKTDGIIGYHVNKVVKENICNSINMDVLNEIVKENTKTNSDDDPNSMSKLKLNPLPLKNENIVDKEFQDLCLVASLENTKTKKTVGPPMDKINKGNECKNPTVDMVKHVASTSKEILKERSKSDLSKELNSMPKINLNPISLKEETIVNKEMIQSNNDIRDIEANNTDNKYYKCNEFSNNVEDDLILSDETSDAFDSHQKPSKTDTKTKSKKKKDSKNSNKIDVNLAKKEEDFVDKKKQRDIKDKETTTEQTKKQKSKKKTSEIKGCDLDEPKAIKTKISKKETDTKTDDIKSKFNELFGDSTSLISTEDLGVVIDRNDISNKYDTIFEDTESAVDLNLKEVEKNQTTIIGCQKAQNDYLNEKVIVKANLSEAVQDHKEKIETDNTVIHDNIVTHAKPPEFKDTLSLPNINAKMDEECPDVVQTVIISSGTQPQTTFEDNENLTKFKSNNVIKSNDKPIKIVALNALATSTPAKSFTDNAIVESMFSKTQGTSNCINATNRNVLTTSKAQSFGTLADIQNSEDIPDVRIFVKRKRKMKK